MFEKTGRYRTIRLHRKTLRSYELLAVVVSRGMLCWGDVQVI